MKNLAEINDIKEAIAKLDQVAQRLAGDQANEKPTSPVGSTGVVADWTKVQEENPPVGEDFLGFDIFYCGIHICIWDGKHVNDDGETRALPIDGNDDVSIEYWMPLPDSPIA